jgi:hypothetical protein
MAMSQKAISGFGGSVTLSTSTAVEVADWSATINHENYDSTHLGSSGYRERKFLIQDVTGSINAHEAVLPSTSHRWFKLALTSSGSGLAYIRFRARHSLGVENGQDKVVFAHDFESTGPITVVS